MSTHRRAWKQRAGVVVALVFGALLTVPATPALAADATVSPNSVTVNAGSDATVSVTVRPDVNDKSGEITLTGLPSGVSCASGCGNFQFNGPPGSQKTVLLTLKANDNAGDATANVTVRVVPDSSDPATPSFSLTVKAKAPPQPETVKSVSGKAVIAANGDPLPGVVVMLRDSQGKQRQTTTDSSGNFRFSGSTSDPIAPGRLDLGANKDGTIGTKSIDAQAGQSITGLRIGVPIEVKASPSPTPSESDDALPTDEATDEATDEPASEAPVVQQQPAANEDSGGFGSWLLILLGGLFVAVGVGTIVLLYMRRKNEGDDVDGDGPTGAAAAAGAMPAARGGYRGADDHTRVVNGMGAGAAPTMVGGGGSLSDAPTMMHRPVVDDVPPDPYGAPPASAYGGGQGGWAGNGYGDEPGPGGYGNAPSSGGGYGNAPQSGGGYGAA
ncbi:carboxypeptidase regulatory-like domain-containing protein, partial [Micromonospora sp. MS34]|uniref:carboxypeptidase regulatory-like domain-containing protein n=1 Tax=Micromonospora sp. MS34 TaxID=3385971 RepID=UPI0039A0686C